MPFAIEENVSLADKNWFRTGGAARYYAAPKNASEFAMALNFAQEKKVDLFLLGEGANILISDEGFPGLIIHPTMTKLTTDHDNGELTAEAGVTIDEMINFSLEHHLCGLEEFAGIPGSVGGAVYINIHYFEFLLSQFLTRATVIKKSDASIHTVSKEWFHFGYDTSSLHTRDYFLLDATFKLTPLPNAVAAAYAKGRRDEIVRHRTRRYPTERTCGSFFRNFHTHEVPFQINGKTIVSIAYYLDAIGAKSFPASGGASISSKHANMIVTKEGATTNDILTLAQKLKQAVHARFGITPQCECVRLPYDLMD
ncbi:MAG: UDP-N-acetylmuramate dehydrogenase [Oligoflexia bacterium]|nr:UDP-N-acetylmuramate dehydrogenase [Oligoflexia bacterium]